MSSFFKSPTAALEMPFSVLVLLTLAVPGIVAEASAPAMAAKPNVLIWVADDQYLESVGCYGGDPRHTPNIDKLAREGMRFTRAYSTSSICTPSRSALYTGMYPIRNGAHPNHSGLKKDIPCMPGIMRTLGYRCGLAGKPGVHEVPTRPSNTFTWDAEFPHTDQVIPGAEGNEDASSKHRVMDYDAAKRFMADREQPFCLFAASSLPHGPELSKIANGYEGYSANNWTADAQFGRFMRMLEETGQAEETLVIYVSDNGSNTKRSKYTLYEPGVHVPMIVRWPGHVRPHTVCHQLVDFTDVMPTLLEIAGSTADEHMDGKSLVPLLNGGDSALRDDLFLSFTALGVNDVDKPYPIRAVVTQRYKLIHNLNHEIAPQKGSGVKQSPEYELYDLLNDRAELRNLAPDDPNSEIMASMKARLERWSRAVGDRGMQTEYEAIAMFPEKLKDLDRP